MGKTFPYHYARGSKTLFDYLNFQISNYVGGQNNAKVSFGSIVPLCPQQLHACLMSIFSLKRLQTLLFKGIEFFQKTGRYLQI